MKKLHLISWIILIIGIVFKFIHWPFASLLVILGCLLMLIFSLNHLIKNPKRKLAKSLLHLTATFITIYILFRIQYWPFAQIVFGLTLLLGIATAVLSLNEKSEFKLNHTLLISYFLGCVALSFVHADRVFYLLNMKAIENQSQTDKCYRSQVLDKYSWFLYLAGKAEEASKINQDATTAARKCIESSSYGADAIERVERIENHGDLIENRNWNEYRP